MQPPFDIAADLDTPVSAYLKLRALAPRFLLESVERGERLARYSFLGFGESLEVRLDGRGFRIGNELNPRPATRDDYLALDDGHRGILKHGCYSAPHNTGADAAVMFGDYFFAEALTRIAFPDRFIEKYEKLKQP